MEFFSFKQSSPWSSSNQIQEDSVLMHRLMQALEESRSLLNVEGTAFKAQSIRLNQQISAANDRHRHLHCKTFNRFENKQIMVIPTVQPRKYMPIVIKGMSGQISPIK